MSRTLRSALAISALTLAFAFAVSGSALAASSTKGKTKATALPLAAASATTQTAPLVQGHVGVQFGPAEQEGGGSTVIVGITLDSSVKLPARVRIPIPQGATMAWAGEILGGDPSADPERQARIQSGTGGQYAEFTLEQAHAGQIEGVVAPPTKSGSQVSAQMTFVQSVPGSAPEFTVRVPANVSDVKITPPAVQTPQTNSTGESLYSLGQQKLAAGGKLTITVSYKLGTAGGATTPSSTTQMPVIVLLVIALVAVLVALVFVLQRGSRTGEDVLDDDDDDDAGDDAGLDDAAAAEDVAESGASEGIELDDSSDDPFDSIDLE